MSVVWPSKDPDEVMDYSADWSRRLGTDTIANDGSTWAIEEGGADLVIQSESIQTGNKMTVVWLIGGTSGVLYTLVNTVVTQSNRTMQEAFYLPVRSKA
jgi:hypothetical protein